jgi:hypothetical protein
VVVSVVASVVLTVLLNVALRIIPGLGRRVEQALERVVERTHPSAGEPARPSVRVIFPWKLMLIGSLVLTVVINLLLWLIR